MSGAKAVAFLAKKSWHTGTIQHMEKVWKAEERAKHEQKKMEELRRELAEERELDKLRKAQEQATGHSRNEKVDFLYQQPMGISETTTEEYLEGKRYTEKGEDNEVRKITSEPGALFLNNSSSDLVLQDKRHKIREDPMFTIKKEEKKAKEKLKDNVVKMQKLRTEVLSKKHKDQKAEKKHKKEKHKRKHTESESDEEHTRKKRRRSESTSTTEAVWVEKKVTVTPNDDSTISKSEKEKEISKSEKEDEKTTKSHAEPRSAVPRKLTAEERQKRLDEMRADAANHEKDRIEQLRKEEELELKEKQDLLQKVKERGAKKELAPEFISSLGRQIYTDKSTSSLQDRLQRNRFYVQKTNGES